MWRIHCPQGRPTKLRLSITYCTCTCNAMLWIMYTMSDSSRYPFCLRARLEENSRYLCAESTEDMLAIAAGFIDAKVSCCLDHLHIPCSTVILPCNIASCRAVFVCSQHPVGGIQTPLAPTKPPPSNLPSLAEEEGRCRGISFLVSRSHFWFHFLSLPALFFHLLCIRTYMRRLLKD